MIKLLVVLELICLTYETINVLNTNYIHYRVANVTKREMIQ